MALEPGTKDLLAAGVALMALTAIMWGWMVATRLPAMRAAGVAPRHALHTANLQAVLPSAVMRVSDNYNHLFEAPTVFYAAILALSVLGGADFVAVAAAWTYVALRGAHSLVQATFNHVPTRFALFTLSWLALIVLIACTARAVAAP